MQAADQPTQICRHCFVLFKKKKKISYLQIENNAQLKNDYRVDSGRFRRLKEIALEYTFVFDILGMKELLETKPKIERM